MTWDTGIPYRNAGSRIPRNAGSGRLVEDGPNAWTLLSMWEAQIEFLTRDFHLAIATTWKVNQRMEDLSSPSVYILFK